MPPPSAQSTHRHSSLVQSDDNGNVSQSVLDVSYIKGDGRNIDMRLRWILICGTALVAGLGVVYMIFFASRPGLSSSPVSPASAAPIAFTPELAKQVADDLHAGDRDRISTRILLPKNQAIPDEMASQLASLIILSAQPGTAHDNGDGTATATFHVVDPANQASDWDVTLIRVDTIWKVVLTEEIK